FLILVSAIGRRISENAEAHSRELLLLREQRAAAEERARIAREVHDGLGHALVSSILRLELCARLLRCAPDEAETILQEEIPALRAAWNEGRDLAFHLRPWESEVAPEEDLPAILRRHLGRFAERTGLRINLQAQERDWRLSPPVMFGLMRIVQEALTNVARHAQATTIEVTLSATPQGGIVCAVCDDGKGFSAAEPSSGFGMRSMRERAEALGGAFSISSRAGCTEIRVEIPAS
ncbi:MAG TPA: sensor histidine kinase, partial [Chthonomonadaceae bacterium]|nr:sensor histidine kinase [Chthonomonadaceae bacterium]